MISPPPPYSEYDERQPVQIQLTVISNEAAQDNTAVTQSTSVSDLVYNYSPEVTLLDYLKNPSYSINSSINVTNSIKGFLDVMYYQQKLPQTFSVALIYKFNLVLFYLINFVYQVVTLLVIQENFGYYITCIIIYFTGLVSGAFLKKCLMCAYAKNG